ncbi:MAG: hypothetical protein RR630_04740 [Coprobacillus sp.]
MDALIELLSETLLWESVSCYVEETVKVSNILKDIVYIDHDVFKEIENAEILSSDEFIIDALTKENSKYYVAFQMPIILVFSNAQEQVLRVTTNVIGSCYVDDENHYDWNQYDFESMNRLELLSHKDLVQNIQCSYQDIECDDLRVI